MAEVLKLEIVTPFGITFSQPVESCVLPGEHGQFQVLTQHAPLISLIKIGAIRVTDNHANQRYLATSGGYCEVKDNKIRVIVESAEPADKINVERAEAARKRAEKRIGAKSPDVDIARAEMALKRALNRLKIARLSV
jgi:F-type H+-transporting ATPase subunit epsilon